jgi:hypothetical protein
MRRYIKLGVIALVVVAVFAAVIGTTVAFAGSPDGDTNADGGPRQVFIGKVANILGLEEEQVADAFGQAHQQMFQEAQEQRIQQAIEDGLITEEEATQIRQWWQDRPEALETLGQPGQPRFRNAW